MKLEKENFRKKKVLITGGLGFIGSNLACRLVELGAKIILIDSLIPEYGGNIFNINDIRDRVTVKISDVRDKHVMESLVKGQDYLFNLVGQTSHLDSMKNPFTDLEINCQAQLMILEACRKYNPDIKIIFSSTRQIYGKPDYLPVDEKHPLRPVDVNGINKMAGEWYHILYNNIYDIRTSVLRLTNTIGPRMRVKDDRQTFLGVWIKSLVKGECFDVWDGRQLRDFTYIDDAVNAFLMTASSEKTNGQILNVGGDCAINLKDLADLLVEITGGGKYNIRPFPSGRRRIDIGDYYSDYNRIRSVLGWEPETPLREALKKTLDYYKKHLNNYL